MRVQGGVSTHKGKKKVLKLAKGYWGGKSRLYRTAKEAVNRANIYAFIGRKRRKRDLRRLWIIRISAATRQEGLSYSRFIMGMNKASLNIDRKMLAEMAVSDKDSFDEIITLVKKQLSI